MSVQYNPATGQYETQGFDSGVFGYDGMNMGDSVVDYSALPSLENQGVQGGLYSSLSNNNGGAFSSQNLGNTLQGIGGIAQGTAGLYGMYLGKQQLDDQKANNSLYRRLAQEQQTNRNNFTSSVRTAFA